MGLSRSFLKAMGLTEEQVQSIVDEHLASVNPLKAERDELKANAEQLAEVKTQLDTANKKIADFEKQSAKNVDYKAKFEELTAEYENAKTDFSNREIKAKKTDALRTALKNANFSDKGIEKVLKFNNADFEIDENGKITNETDFMKSIGEEWGEYIVTEDNNSHSPAQPPVNTGGTKLTKEQILAIPSTADRQKAISENIELFQ